MLAVWLKADFNTKVTEVDGKVPNVASLVKKQISIPLPVEGKTPDVSSLVKKADYATEITNIKNDYVTNTALNTGHKDLVQKTKLKSELKKVDDKASENSSKVLSYEHKLKQREDIINDLERYAFYFRGKNYFNGSDGAQNSLVVQVGENYFKHNFGSNSSKIKIWKSKDLNSQSLDLSGTVGIIKCGSIVNIYIVYSLKKLSKNYKFR